MTEINEYLSKLYRALQEEDIETLEEVNGSIDTDDGDPYEEKDLREIEVAVTEYIENKDKESKERALLLIDEFDVDTKYDEYDIEE